MRRETFIQKRQHIRGVPVDYDVTTVLYADDGELAYEICGDVNNNPASEPRYGWVIRIMNRDITAWCASRDDALRFLGFDPGKDDVPLDHYRQGYGRSPVVYQGY